MKTKIRDIATVINGSTPSTKHLEYYGGDIVWITPKDLSDQGAKYIYRGERTITKLGFDSCSTEMIPADNILMSSRAPIGLLSINKVDCCTNQGFKSLIVNKEKCDVEYLYYYLKMHIKEIEALGSGTTFKEVSKASMENYEIDLPPLYKQKSIANILKSIDDKIILNSKTIDELYSFSKDLFDYWFIQYDFPNCDFKPYKHSGGAMRFDEEYQMNIPLNWKIVSLKDVVSSEKYAIVDGPFGTQMKVEEYVSNGIPVYEMEQLNGKFIVCDFRHFISIDKFESIKRSAVRNGDIVISKTGTLGLLGIVNSPYYNEGILVSRLAKITPSNTIIGTFGLLLYLDNLTKSGYWMQKSGGSTMPILNNKLLENVPIVLPNNDLFMTFESKVKPMFDKIFKLQNENLELSKLLNDCCLKLLLSKKYENI